MEVAPQIQKLDQGATAYFVAQALVEASTNHLGAFEYDMDGALEAGQYGMAYLAARTALRLATFIQAAAAGAVSSPQPQWQAISVRFVGIEHDSGLWAQAWALETRNPTTPDEVVRYVDDCRAFMRNVLHLDEHATWKAVFSDDALARHYQLAGEFGDALAYLGVEGVGTTGVQRKVEARAVVTDRLQRSGESD